MEILSVGRYAHQSVRPSICRSVGSSVGWFVTDFLIFQKRGFEGTNSNLSNTTKFILLDSLLEEVTAQEIQIATCLIRISLYCLIHFFKRLLRPKSN